jgi:hypothetical protein
MNTLAFLIVGAAIFFGPSWGIIFGLAYLLGGVHGLVVAFALRFLKLLSGTR